MGTAAASGSRRRDATERHPRPIQPSLIVKVKSAAMVRTAGLRCGQTGSKDLPDSLSVDTLGVKANEKSRK